MHNLRHARRRWSISAPLNAHRAIGNDHAHSRQVTLLNTVEQILSRRLLRGIEETKLAARPAAINPQFRLRIFAVFPVAMQIATSAGISPSDDSIEIMRKIQSGCNPIHPENPSPE